MVVIGAVHEAEPALEALLTSVHADVVTVVTPTPAGVRQKSGAVDLSRMARAAGVPVLRADDANAPSVVEVIDALAPDLVVVVGWNQLIGPALLSIPRRGCIGFHASLLPKHRGHAPVNWAILRGEVETGNTMMLLDPGADTGDIVAQTRIPISPEDTCASVYRRVGTAGARMLVEFLPALLDGTAPRRPQRREDGDLLPRRTPEMGIIDWNRPAGEVYDWIRALTQPYPGAFTTAGGRRFMVWSARAPRDEPTTSRRRPGTIVDAGPGGVRVAAQAGSIVLTRMSEAGRPPVHASTWFRQAGVPIGAAFDRITPAVAQWARHGGRRPESLR